MLSKLAIYLSSLLIVLIISSGIGWGSPANPKIDPALQGLRPDEEVSVIVKLTNQVDPSLAVQDIKGRRKSERLRRTIKALKDGAATSQGAIVSDLGLKTAMGLVRGVRPFWIFNGIAMKARREVIDELAARPDVSSIYLDRAIPLSAPVLAAAGTPEANLNLINAPALWNLGYTGQGVVVANMDTGVDVTHPDLSGSYRGGTNSWYDPYGQHNTPYDADGHGTSTMGIMVGGNTGGNHIGVAPGARWIAVKAFNDSGIADTSKIHAGYEWLMDPDGNPDTDDAPDVVNNSWGFQDPGCDREYAADVLALRSAGIVPVFSAGNSGPLAQTDISPGNYAESISAGATDNSDNIASFSSRGPSSCDGTIFPVVCAPGVNIYTTALSHGGALNYVYESGTSFSAPHVSGAAALLLSANPSLTVADIESALTGGSVDLGTAGPDNTFGYGRLDVLRAYNAMPASGNFDDCSAAKVVASLPYSVTVSTATATKDIADPAACALAGYTVWYTYTPVSSCQVSVDTAGSDYDTVLAVYSGTCGSFTLIACNNDVSSGTQQSRVLANLTGGTTYYVMVGAYDTKGGGVLRLKISEVIPLSVQSAVTLDPPYASAGVPKQITATFKDNNGASEINTAYVLVNAALTGVGGAYIRYDRGVNRLYLMNDSGTSWLGGLAPGAAGTITNSQCTVNCAQCSATVSGIDFTLGLSITFKAAFAGVRKVYMYASSTAGQNTGWMQKSTLAVYAASASAPVDYSVSTAAATISTSAPMAYTAIYTDANGGWDIRTAHMLINTALTGTGGVYLYYSRDANLLYLRNDANTAWSAGIAPGTAGTLSNARCTVSCASSSVAVSATSLTLKLVITPAPAFAGSKNIYLYSLDRGGLNSGWVLKKTISIVSSTPVPMSITPNAGSIPAGRAQIFTAVYRDADGATDIGYAYLNINGTTALTRGIYLMYDRAVNLLYLRNDANTAWSAGVAPGAAVTLSNSQCTVNCATSGYVATGTSLTLNVSITPKTAFRGPKLERMSVQDKSGKSSAWLQKGTITVY